MRFLARRLLESLILLLLLSVLVFLLMAAIPGDFLSEMELNPTVSRQAVEELRRDFGLQEPVYRQYAIWMHQIFRGNLGYSFDQRRPAADLIGERLGNTLLLAGSAFLLILLLSVPLATLSAYRAGGWVDRMGMIVTLLGLSLPSLLLSLLALFFAYRTGWFPIGGTGSLRHLVLPSLTLALPLSAFWYRTLRLELIEVFQQPFMLAVAAKGLSLPRTLWHALRNALNPLISIMGLTAGGLLSGSVVVEKVFQWPGLGSLTVDAILARDLYVVVNCVLVAAVFTVAANALADLLLAWNDPRIRDS